MKIVSVRNLGEMSVFDLSVDSNDHSFIHETGIVLHNCAYVISDIPVADFIPTMRISDTTCTSYTAASVEAVGGLKMDFLVLSTLLDIGDTLQLIQKRWEAQVGEGLGKVPDSLLIPGRGVVRKSNLLPFKGQWFDIWSLPEDQAVFADVSLGKTETVFQFNTPGAIKWLKCFSQRNQKGQYGINSIESMAAFTALNRPGPLDAMVADENGNKHNMLIEYAHRVAGEKSSNDILPIFNEMLPETHGIMVFQEQLQKMYQELIGCTGPEAEAFRGYAAKKKVEKIVALHEPFIQKATAKVGSKEIAEEVWNLFISWSAYGFNRAHAICYTVIAYTCAFLKHYYPLEWWTSVLKNADKNEINEVFWKHCGHLIDLPDVSKSGAVFEIQNNRVRAPLSLLQGIGEKAHAQLCAGAPYLDISDFCWKIQRYKELNATTTTSTKTQKVKRLDHTGKPIKEAGKFVYDEVEVPVEKKRLATSALNRSVVYRLIVSGAMDSILPKTRRFDDGTEVELTVVDHLAMYEECLAAVSCKKVEAVPATYSHLTPLTRYQMRKSILPAFSSSLLSPVIESRAEGIVSAGEGDNRQWIYRGCAGDSEGLWPFLTVARMKEIEELSPFPSDTIKIAVVGYVESQRKFVYKKDEAGERKEACELVLDIDGNRIKMVRWPRNGKIPRIFKDELKGAIVIALLSKNSEKHPFSLNDVVVVCPSLTEPGEGNE